MWEGTLYDGRTAAGHPVEVDIGPDGLTLAAEDGRRRWPYADLHLVQGRREDEPVRLERQGASLVVNNPGFLDQLPERARLRLIRPPAGKGMAALAAGLVVLLATGLLGYLYLLPPLTEAVAARIPPAWEQRLGDATAARFLAGFATCEDPAANRAVAEIMTRLETALPDNPYPLRVTIVKDKMVNAFALPGGRIVVMGGLLATTATPEELAGVLAHETAHVLRRHATTAMIRNGSTSLLLRLLFGNDNLGGVAAGGLQALSQLRYSRESEQEADLRGLELVRAAGIDPQGMIDFLAHLEEKEEETAMPAYLSTHPATADRINALEREIPPASGGQPFLMGQKEWSALQGSCR